MTIETVEPVREHDIVVEKIYRLSYREFAEKHLFANYPVVIGDACKDWSASYTFTPDFFKTHYADREVTIAGKTYTLGEYIDWMLTGTEDNPAPYPCTLQIEQDYPELLPDVQPPLKYALPDRIRSKFLPNRFLSGTKRDYSLPRMGLNSVASVEKTHLPHSRRAVGPGRIGWWRTYGTQERITNFFSTDATLLWP